MAEGVTQDLLLAALWIGLFGFAVLYRYLPLPTALYITLVKVAIPVIYFAFFFDDAWTLSDDLNYVSQGAALVDAGYTPFSLLTDSSLFVLLKSITNSNHNLYGVVNFIGQYLFGKHYYSAVFLNVGITFIFSLIVLNIVDDFNYSRSYKRSLLIFLLLHWDVLVWSSIVNLKDIVVMTLTSVCLLLILKLMRRIKIVTFFMLLLVVFLFSTIRFYIPLLMFSSIGIWILSQAQDRRKFLLLPFVLAIFYYLFTHNIQEFQFFNPGGILYGLFRFPLTPQPWTIDDNYSFLLLPSIIHWMWFVPSLYGGWLLWRSDKLVRFVFIYLLVVMVFYALFEAEQGPRHRVQITGILAWMQFHAFWVIRSKIMLGTLASPLTNEGTV